jgi:hypothetical protein
MQTSSSFTSSRSTCWRSLAAKILMGVAVMGIVVLSISFLEFKPPKLPEPSLYRITPGVGGIGFFNASCGERDDKQGYSYRFMKRDARCIYAELHVPPNLPEATLHVTFYDVNGQAMYEENLLRGKESSAAIIGVYEGQHEPGRWQPGIYRVEFMAEGEIIAADEFQIIDP